MKIHFHKWKSIYVKEFKKFNLVGKQYSQIYLIKTDYRICEKCKQIIEIFFTPEGKIISRFDKKITLVARKLLKNKLKKYYIEKEDFEIFKSILHRKEVIQDKNIGFKNN